MLQGESWKQSGRGQAGSPGPESGLPMCGWRAAGRLVADILAPPPGGLAPSMALAKRWEDVLGCRVKVVIPKDWAGSTVATPCEFVTEIQLVMNLEGKNREKSTSDNEGDFTPSLHRGPSLQ